MKIEIKKSSKLVNYTYAIKFLEERVDDVINEKKPELLWILQHKAVFTAGTSYKKHEILNKSIEIIKTSRGGKITYHGPGQIIVYFVLNLNKRKKDIRNLIRNIEKCIILTLKEFNIKSHYDKKNIGIWVNHKKEVKKVAAIGIRVKKWIAFHGFAINISNNIDVYKKIVPCGLYNKKITNLKSIKKRSYKNIDKLLIKNFLSIFK